MIKLTINDIPSSNNTTQGKGGVKKALEYAEEKQKWKGYAQALRARMRDELKEINLPYDEASVIMIHHFKTTARRDPDNFGGKQILDSLVSAAFIKDDSFFNVDIMSLATFGNEKASVDIYIIKGKKWATVAKNLFLKEDDLICGAI